MQDKLFRKGLVIGIIILFVGACVLPVISGNTGKINNLPSEEKNDEIGVNTLDSDLVGWWSFAEGSDVTAYDYSRNVNDGIINDATCTTNTPSNEGYGLSYGDDDIPPKVTITNPEAGNIYLLGVNISRKIEKWIPQNATACIGGFFFMAKIEANITDKETGVNSSRVYAYIDRKPDDRYKLDYKGSGKYVGNLFTKGIFIEGLNTANLIVEAEDYYDNLGNDTIGLKFYTNII